MSASARVTVNLKTGRAATSCGECQRRKQKCNKEWPCNHCQSRNVPHLCQFPSDKKGRPSAASVDKAPVIVRPQKRNVPAQDTETELSHGLSNLGYSADSDTVAFTRKTLNLKHIGAANQTQGPEIETALRSILPKIYTDLLVQNFLDVSNYQYYSCFPAHLQGQCADWWGDRSDGRALSPEFTCLLLQVCASSVQFLKEDLRLQLEVELGDKAQVLTERFHAAGKKLNDSIAPSQVQDSIVMVQQLFLGAVWYKYEAKMIEAWHALGAAIRAAQESGMHKDSESNLESREISDFDREMRRRLWCIIWNADWQMSGVLSRPVHTDQKDMKLGLPARLEGNADAEVPTPIASVAYQAQVGVIIAPLFRRLGQENSVDLTLRIEKEVEKWMDSFSPVLRDHRPNTDWDDKYPYIPFMRWQLNVVAYSFLLGPLKAYLIGAGDPTIKGTKRELDLKAKGIDTCLSLLDTAEGFYKLIYPASVKYFFILFFIFDGATVLCSALAHDLDRSLPKRDRVVLALRQSLDLLEGVTHLSKTAVISAAVLKSLLAVLPLTAHEKGILGWEDRSKRLKPGSTSSADSSTQYAAANRSGSTSTTVVTSDTPQKEITASSSAEEPVEWLFNPAMMPTMAPVPDASGYSMASASGGTEVLTAATQQQQLGQSVPMTTSGLTSTPLEHLENLWDWKYLNMGL